MRSATCTQYVTYNELAGLFGRRMAYVVLTLIERSAEVRMGNVIDFDCEKRLRSAFDAMRGESLAA
jgi:hypothetical protein